MVEDDSSSQDGGFRPTIAALRRARREIRVAVGHGVESLQNWIAQRWLPIRLAIVGGFSWTTSRVFGWLWIQLVGFGSWLASSLIGIIVPSAFSTQILVLFFVVYAIHSGIQTKLTLDIKTNLVSMTTDGRSNVRTDGGGYEQIWLPVGAIGGIIMGATIGWSFGVDGVFVGAGVGWVLGDEFDRWFDEKFMGPWYTTQDEEHHVEER